MGKENVRPRRHLHVCKSQYVYVDRLAKTHTLGLSEHQYTCLLGECELNHYRICAMHTAQFREEHRG